MRSLRKRLSELAAGTAGMVGLGLLVAACFVGGFLVASHRVPGLPGASPASPAATASQRGGDSGGSGDEPSAPTTAVIPSPAAPAGAGSQPADPQSGDLSGAQALKKKIDISVADKPTSLVIGSFNVLGSSHTVAHSQYPGMASGVRRMAGVVNLLGSHKMDVVGLQELQRDQRAAFRSLAGGTYDFYPDESLGDWPGKVSIAWRKDKYDLVDPGSYPIPSFNGVLRAAPVILLRDKATGMQFYVTNFHNPTSTTGYANQGRFRDEAKRAQLTLFRQLQATGIPMFATGDMNEGGSYYCSVAPGADLVAAAGGSTAGGCSPPSSVHIDWILGSQGIGFSDYSSDRSGYVRSVTDHPVVTATATLTPKAFPKAVSAPTSP